MKAVILAAGYGKRIGKLTNNLPKPLIPLVNKPILQHLIENLKQIGIEEFIIAVGHLKNQIVSFLSTLPKKEIKVTIKFVETFKKGPLYSFATCMDEIDDDEFILTPADFLINPSVLSNFLQETRGQQLTLAFDDCELKIQHTKVHLSINQGIRRVLGISSNIIGENSEVKVLLPLLVCRINFRPYIENCLKLKYTKVMDAVEFYLQQKKIATAVKIQNTTWFDLDTIQDVLTANNFLLSQIISIDQSLKRFNSQNIILKKPVLIGENCRMEEN